MMRALLILAMLIATQLIAQPDRWQQRVKYVMNIDMNVQTNQFTGKQKLEYWNNSPDTLTRVFYHLYFNAFQPGSMMDTRSRRQGTITSGRGADWDMRVRDRIQKLKPDEIGYQKILSVKMNGRPQQYQVDETILEVKLDKPILPRSKVVFDMDFEAQVPLQIRRSGRDNPSSKVRYSMSQWYPKMCEYDNDGWHPTPYVAREFYGVWGDFDVDGQTSTALLVQTLQALNAHVVYYVPVRGKESHGIHIESLKPIIDNGATLLLTCDTGITAHEAIDYANSRGLTVVGMPCNQFMGQEPGTAEEIATFCSTTYGVTFPLLEKADVNGDDRHPLYAALTETADAAGEAGDVQWNFEKFLVGSDGEVVARFRPRTEPDAPEVVEAIEAAL